MHVVRNFLEEVGNAISAIMALVVVVIIAALLVTIIAFMAGSYLYFFCQGFGITLSPIEYYSIVAAVTTALCACVVYLFNRDQAQMRADLA